MKNKGVAPKLGPEPTLLSRKEVDVLYETLRDVLRALEELKVDAIVTGGSLLGAIRQHSILFCDDDIDLTIVDYDGSIYDTIVVPKLQDALGKDYIFRIKPWEGGDQIRPKRMSNIFLDLFVLRRFESIDDLKSLICLKKNGQLQSDSYVSGILDKLLECSESQGGQRALCPFWHFNTRKAIEMWTKEVYRENELFPLSSNLKMGPVTGIKGPRMPVKLLKRAFGADCFDVYYQSASHRNKEKLSIHHQDQSSVDSKSALSPLVSAGGTWEGGVKTTLDELHYLPMQPLARSSRRPSLHNKERLMEFIEQHTQLEKECDEDHSVDTALSIQKSGRPHRTVYMDGVFDLFHIGHLEAIRQCSALGDKVIIGVTGDKDAEGYKRSPIVPESERVAIIQALREVDQVICPCPLVVTERFMEDLGIDLVVHGFANDEDAERQKEFFETPVKMGKFRRIEYYRGLSTTDRINGIQSLSNEEANSGTSNSVVIAPKKPQWFGSALASAVGASSEIPFDPFPLHLRQAIEPHIRKATNRRKEALHAIRHATGLQQYDELMTEFWRGAGKEGSFTYDESAHDVRLAFLQGLGLQPSYDMSKIHETLNEKTRLLHTFTCQHRDFQESFDAFVTNVCAPHLATLVQCDTIYYQAFPCLRIVEPSGFSIGPHSDVAYGHHPCSINYYVPLTRIGGASALYLESRVGAEDWHPIEGDYGESNKTFSTVLSPSSHGAEFDCERFREALPRRCQFALDYGQHNRLHESFA